MSTHKQRVATLKALTAGSVVAATSAHTPIQEEFDAVVVSGRVRIATRRRILQVLHATRALDSALKEFKFHHGITGGYSINEYLKALTKHTSTSITRLPPHEQARYKASIANIRNRYMHEAGAFPASDAEVATLLGEMDACLARVYSL